MKHSRISLLERAAEVYDFGAALRARSEPPPIEAAPPPREAPRSVRGMTAAVDRLALAEAGYIAPEAPDGGTAEEFRLIKRQILAAVERAAALSEEKRRTLLVSSALPGEGKTFCAINLALSLAGERDAEAVLVEADLSKPEILSTLGIAPGPGLIEALADRDADPEDFVLRTDVPGLSVLPAGARTNDAPELLASDRMREVLARLVAADRRRIVLFDTPPVLMASTAAMLAGHVGQALVVVRADQTTEADLREAVGLLSGCDRVALVLNGAAFGVNARQYGASYGHGHED